MLSELFILFTPSTCSYIKEFKKWESLEFSVGNRRSGSFLPRFENGHLAMMRPLFFDIKNSEFMIVSGSLQLNRIIPNLEHHG